MNLKRLEKVFDLGLVVHAYNSSICIEVEGILQVQGQPVRHGDSEIFV